MDRAQSTVRRWPLRNTLGMLALAAAVGVGFLLQRSGLLNVLVASVMQARIAREAPPREPFAVRVLDEDGQPVSAFQLMLQSAGAPLGSWQGGAQGLVQVNGADATFHGDAVAIDVLVRADGYASTLTRFAGPGREELLSGRATTTLRRGESVELRFRVPQGLSLPDGFAPDLYTASQRVGVRLMWNPDNRLAYKKLADKYKDHMPDHNFFNIKNADEARFTFQVSSDTDPFYVGVNSPGVLQFYEAGPFAPTDLKDGILEIELPTPASLEVAFDSGVGLADKVPFERARIDILRRDPNKAWPTYINVASVVGDARRQELKIADLAPGIYAVNVVAPMDRNAQGMPLSQSQDGVYRDCWREVVLAEGETRRLDLHYVPFDPSVFRGDRTARIRVIGPDGVPARGRKARVKYRDEHYGDLDVYSGRTSASGELEIPGLAEQKSADAAGGAYLSASSAVGAYLLEIDDYDLGSFRFSKGTPSEVFTLRLPPRVGDIAPNIDLVNVSTGVRTKLHDLRGKVVCLELWATSCGPCQEPMRKLVQLASEHRDTWRDRVALVPLSIDEKPEEAWHHVKQRSWDAVDHYWSGWSAASGSTEGQSPAMLAFVAHAVPESIVIDRLGRIFWRGRPADDSDGKDVAARIDEALARGD